MLKTRFMALSFVLATIHAWAMPTGYGKPVQSGSYTIYGRVSLPDDRPATRVIVKLDGPNGLHREAQTNDQGYYELFNIPSGRYRMTVSNPADSTQYADTTEADTSRTITGRLLVHLFLRTPSAGSNKNPKPGVVTVAEATQNIPKTAQKAFKQGIKYKAKDKLDQALESFNQAIESYPEYFQALSERGEIKIKREQIKEAAADFERALKLNKDYEPALRGLGFCKLHQQDYAEAAHYLERATAADSNNANTYLYLGIANLMLDRRETAREALQRALRINALETITARRFLSEIYAREQRYQEAADELRAFLTAVPAAPNADKLKALEVYYRSRASAPKN